MTHEDGNERNDEGLSAEARELEAQLHRYAREGMHAAGQAGADPDERTVQAMYTHTRALNPEAGFFNRSAQAAIALVQGGDRRAPWPYWYPWLPLAAAVGLIVVAMTFMKRPPAGDNPGGAPITERQEDTPVVADGSGDQDGSAPVSGGQGDSAFRDIPVVWGDAKNGMQLGVRLVNAAGFPVDRLEVFEQARVEIFARNTGDNPAKLLMSKGRNAAGQEYPYLYPLQAQLSLDGKPLMRGLEEPVYPLGTDLDSTFAFNEIGGGVTFKAVVSLSSLCRAGTLLPVSINGRNTYDGALLQPGRYALSLTYSNSLRSLGESLLWTGTMDVSLSFSRSPVSMETPSAMMRCVKKLDDLSDINWTLPQIIALMGDAYKGKFRSQVQGRGGPARLYAEYWLHVGDWLIGVEVFDENYYQFVDVFLYLPLLCNGNENEPWASALYDGVTLSTKDNVEAYRTAMFTVLDDPSRYRRSSNEHIRRVDVLVFNPTDKPLALPAFACIRQEMGFDFLDMEGASLTGETPSGISKVIEIAPHSFYGYNVELGYCRPGSTGPNSYMTFAITAPEMVLSNRGWVEATGEEKKYLTLTTNRIFYPEK